MKKIWCMYTMEYYSGIKKDGIMSRAVTWMDLETVIPSEVRIEKDKYPVILLICGILKNCTNEPIYKTGRVTDTEKKHGYQQRKG